jgi:hypothetical protein
LDGQGKEGAFVARFRLIQQPGQGGQIALEGGFGKIDQLPGPIAAVEAAAGGRGRVAVDLA